MPERKARPADMRWLPVAAIAIAIAALLAVFGVQGRPKAGQEVARAFGELVEGALE